MVHKISKMVTYNFNKCFIIRYLNNQHQKQNTQPTFRVYISTETLHQSQTCLGKRFEPENTSDTMVARIRVESKCLFRKSRTEINLSRGMLFAWKFISVWKSSAYQPLEETRRGRLCIEGPSREEKQRERDFNARCTWCCFQVENFLSADKGNRETRAELAIIRARGCAAAQFHSSSAIRDLPNFLFCISRLSDNQIKVSYYVYPEERGIC